MGNQTSEQRLFDLNDAAKYLGRKPFAIRTLLWSGKLSYMQTGKKGKIYIDVKDMDTFIEKSKIKHEF